jgi:hypothetical protein
MLDLTENNFHTFLQFCKLQDKLLHGQSTVLRQNNVCLPDCRTDLSLQYLHIPLEDHIQWFEGMVFMLLAPQSTLMADAHLACLTIDTHFLMMGFALLFLRGRNSNSLLDRLEAYYCLHNVYGRDKVTPST